MKDQKFLLGLIAGISLVAAVAVVLSFFQPRIVIAEGAGGPGSAGAVTALTAKYSTDQDILFLIDSNEQIILTYILHGPTSAGADRTKKDRLEFLSARTYKWDKKAPRPYNISGKTPDEIKKIVIEESEGDEGTPKEGPRKKP